MGPIDLIPGAFGLIAVGVILYFARKGGEDKNARKIAERDAESAARVADARASSPHDDAELSKRLLDPKRPL